MSIVVQVDHLYKEYRRSERPKRLRHDLWQFLRGPATTETPFYALNDVSFSIRQGECVGLIGRNGSGKTTLLRVLAGITRPTRGQVGVTGRFAALIALSAGFNVNRTGRDNIYLSAAMQGLAPHTVAPLADEIIAFAELEAFIDTAVRHYSSGMIARLGFSIAVHLLPDIVFLDEILSVGDSGFQAKSFARIAQFKQEGRTLLIVSHGGDVQRLAERTLWLDQGCLMQDGLTADVMAAYHASLPHAAP